MSSTFEVNIEDVEPMSRTYQYRKVMKPMLERKRRARINKCLDELKDLMVGALQSEGETITKLEKADVLELTVRHLRKLKQHQALAIPSQNHAQEKFRAGFTHCANEVTKFVSAIPGVNFHVSNRLLQHLSHCITQISTAPPMQTAVVPPPAAIAPITVSVPKVYTPPASPESSAPSSPTPSLNLVSPQPKPTIVSPQPSPISAQPIQKPIPQINNRVQVPAGSPVWRPW